MQSIKRSHYWAGKGGRHSVRRANGHIQQRSSQALLEMIFSEMAIDRAPPALLRFTWQLWIDPNSLMKGECWQGAYLAVCGADGKPDVGGHHHSESWSQFNGEAAAGGSIRDTSQALFVLVSLTPQGAIHSPEHSLGDCWLLTGPDDINRTRNYRRMATIHTKIAFTIYSPN